MIKIKSVSAIILLLFASSAVRADLEIYKDYDLSDTVISMATVKVDSNMGDVYLEGLKSTWVEANEISKELGHIRDYKILASELPESGEFNLVLLVYFDSAADLEPSRKRYNAFMKKWGRKNEEKNKSVAKTYPNVRTLTGEYRLREIIMK